MHQTSTLATLIVAATGALWGFYWLPVRALEAAGLPGALGTLAVTGCAALMLGPVVLLRRSLAGADRGALAAVALGGAAFALYSVAFLHGRVAMIVLLYFLTPVWSVLIGRLLLGWRIAPLRLVALALGVAGLLVMLGADGGAPVPETFGEWLGLVSGMLWAVSTTALKLRPSVRPDASALAFALGAVAVTAAMALIPGAEPAPLAPLRAGALALAAGALWWVASILALLWATVRLEPARVGILLMTEVVVGAASAAVLAGEPLSTLELAGGALVLLAGVFEVWPDRRAAPHH